jgi:curved DNA-binding protein CbpA
MVVMAHKDWYALLQLPPEATTDEIAQAVEKRSRQATALANTAPERSQQLREQTRAIKRDLLSGDEARAAYDVARLGHAETSAPPAAEPDTTIDPDAQPFATGYTQPAHQDFQYQQPGYDQQYTQPWGRAQPVRPRSSNRFLKFMQSGFTCPQCSEGYLPGAKFCTQCCTQLVEHVSYVPVTIAVTNPNACPYCGTVAASTHRYCRNCGASRPALGG